MYSAVHLNRHGLMSENLQRTITYTRRIVRLVSGFVVRQPGGRSHWSNRGGVQLLVPILPKACVLVFVLG